MADALVVPGGDSDSHWDESARTIIAGLIAHLLASGKGKTLVDLRNALRQDAEGLDALFARDGAGSQRRRPARQRRHGHAQCRGRTSAAAS